MRMRNAVKESDDILALWRLKRKREMAQHSLDNRRNDATHGFGYLHPACYNSNTSGLFRKQFGSDLRPGDSCSPRSTTTFDAEVQCGTEIYPHTVTGCTQTSEDASKSRVSRDANTMTDVQETNKQCRVQRRSVRVAAIPCLRDVQSQTTDDIDWNKCEGLEQICHTAPVKKSETHAVLCNPRPLEPGHEPHSHKFNKPRQGDIPHLLLGTDPNDSDDFTDADSWQWHTSSPMPPLPTVSQSINLPSSAPVKVENQLSSLPTTNKDIQIRESILNYFERLHESGSNSSEWPKDPIICDLYARRSGCLELMKKLIEEIRKREIQISDQVKGKDTIHSKSISLTEHLLSLKTHHTTS